MESLLSNPLAAIGFIVVVVYMAMVYVTQKERAKVRQMKARRGFAPQWSSGRKHRAKRRGGSGGGGFQPQWNRERRAPRADSGQPGETPPGDEAER